MSEPTHGERALGTRLKLEPAALAAARDALNTIASLPWPREERIALLSRVARSAKADVGEVLGGLALDAAPLAGFDALIPLPGLADKRVAGLARALATFDAKSVSAEGGRLREAWASIATLRAENGALRTELDRLRAQQPVNGGVVPPASSPMVMRLEELATSVGAQVKYVDELLRTRDAGLRLGTVDLKLAGAGAMVNGEVSLDLGFPAGGSAMGLSFVPSAAGGSNGFEEEVPDVAGYTSALAQRKLAERGFAVSVTSVPGAQGIVSDQTPRAGSAAPTGSLVRLIVR